MKQAFLEQIQALYCLEIIAPFSLVIHGRQVCFDCLIKGYGAPQGMIIDAEWDKFDDIEEHLVSLGYGYSCFELAKQCNVMDFEETLADWGKNDK